LQLVLNATTTESAHLFPKLRLRHELSNGFCKLCFSVRSDINGDVFGRKARFFQIEATIGFA
jgi:hypothetical protein